jgi:hypothetical protein
VGISQYAYIRHCDFEPGVPIDIAVNAGKDWSDFQSCLAANYEDSTDNVTIHFFILFF